MSAIPMCPGCRALLEPGDAACPYCGWNLERTEVRRRGGTVERALAPFGGMVPVLIFANALLAAVTAAVHVPLAGAWLRDRGADGDPVELLVDGVLGPGVITLLPLGANAPALVLHGEAWRLLTAVFLHGGLLHIAINMMALRDVGRACEAAYGTGKALALYLLCGLAGSLGGVAWFLLRSGIGWDPRSIPSVGASGAICGLFGLLAAVGFRFGGEQGKALWKEMVRPIAILMVLGVVLSMSGSPWQFDNAAHAGGFLFGLGAGFVCSFGVRARGEPSAVRRWDAAAVVLSVLTLLSFLPAALRVAGALR